MQHHWVTVFGGPMWETIAHQALLDSEGLTTFVADVNTKMIDPFITGAGSFVVELKVPEDQVETALAILAEHEHASARAKALDPAAPEAWHG